MTAAARCRERALLLPCEGERLLAVLAEPEGEAASDLGVVIVVGGPQYRAGSHRLFVHLARSLADAGFPVLRFDVRGMGDATGPLHDFERITPDIGTAIDGLCAAVPSLRRIVLWGLCDGASATLLYLHDQPDPRVRALALVNPWVRTSSTQARARLKHYYLRRVFSPGFWRKALAGRVGLDAARDLLGTARAASDGPGNVSPPTADRPAGATYAERMTRCASRLKLPVLLQMSGSDHTAREFDEFAATSPAWQRLLGADRTTRADYAGADHTLSGTAALQRSLHDTLLWLRELATLPLSEPTR